MNVFKRGGTYDLAFKLNKKVALRIKSETQEASIIVNRYRQPNIVEMQAKFHMRTIDVVILRSLEATIQIR